MSSPNEKIAPFLGNGWDNGKTIPIKECKKLVLSGTKVFYVLSKNLTWEYRGLSFMSIVPENAAFIVFCRESRFRSGRENERFKQ